MFGHMQMLQPLSWNIYESNQLKPILAYKFNLETEHEDSIWELQDTQAMTLNSAP